MINVAREQFEFHLELWTRAMTAEQQVKQLEARVKQLEEQNRELDKQLKSLKPGSTSDIA